MNMQVEHLPQFECNQKVRLKIGLHSSSYKNREHLVGKDLIVLSINGYHSRHFRPIAWTWSYSVSPVDLEGFEHDDERWIGETELERSV